ncbi:MAG TPA: hypothetical protein VNK05_13170 [Chloroflexota bacterium]|nr:hypothetical protein [Chloroflexota bacterium]
MVDAQRDDLAVLRARWPDRTSPESRAALARLRRRVAPGGDADEAMAAVHAAYDGAVPPVVRRRLEHYAREQLPEGPQTAASRRTDERGRRPGGLDLARADEPEHHRGAIVGVEQRVFAPAPWGVARRRAAARCSPRPAPFVARGVRTPDGRRAV